MSQYYFSDLASINRIRLVIGSETKGYLWLAVEFYFRVEKIRKLEIQNGRIVTEIINKNFK